MNTFAILPLGVIGPWQVVIIALVILLLFGGRKIPELMEGLGKGMKSFKKGLNEIERETKEIEKDLKAAAKEPDEIKKVD